MLTSEQVKDIEERAAKATPGPWSVDEIFDEDDGTRFRSIDGWSEDGEEYLCLCEADAEFVADARTDIPALLADRRELVELLDRVSMSLSTIERRAIEDGANEANLDNIALEARYTLDRIREAVPDA